MNLVYKSRIALIRFAKVFPFLLCFIVFISLSETLFALVLKDFVSFDGGIIPNTPIAWFIASKCEFGLYSVIIAIFLSIAFETCVWNKASEIYLLALLKQQTYFPTIELYPEYIYVICIANIALCCFFCYKGIIIITRKSKS
jgi:hypothetical protein